MRVMALCSRNPGENWHFSEYPHLKPEENCPRIPLVTLWGTGNSGKLHTQHAHPKEEGGQPSWDSTPPKSNCCCIQALLNDAVIVPNSIGMLWKLCVLISALLKLQSWHKG